jgi:hypothetical protein
MQRGPDSYAGSLAPPDGHSLITIARREDQTNRPTPLHFHSSWCAAGAIRLLSAGDYRVAHIDAFRVWLEIVGITTNA